ncbi:MAG TPA: hypothetical protein VK939_05635 [Longimicrobiales bacterium]|nr:hypothetical protein [Longimicrobiales bacterium]
MRSLLITRRTVPLDRLDEYTETWAAFCAAAAAHGCRTWMFRRSGHEDRFVEFLEWTGESPLESDDVSAALLELDGCGAPQDADLWEEASLA